MKKKKAKPRRKCRWCGKAFTAYREWARFCSSKCRLAFWQDAHPRISEVELTHLRRISKEAEKSL